MFYLQKTTWLIHVPQIPVDQIVYVELVEQLRTARAEPRCTTNHQLADQNVASIPTVPLIVPAEITNATIHVQALAVHTQFVLQECTHPFAVAQFVIQATHSHVVCQVINNFTNYLLNVINPRRIGFLKSLFCFSCLGHRLKKYLTMPRLWAKRRLHRWKMSLQNQLLRGSSILSL